MQECLKWGLGLHMALGFEGYNHPIWQLRQWWWFLFVLLISQEQKDNGYLFCCVQGRRGHLTLLHFWWVNPLFPNVVKLSFSEYKEMVILEACSPSERVTTLGSYIPPSPYFDVYLPFIKDMIFLFPFYPFFIQVMRISTSFPPSCSLTVRALSGFWDHLWRLGGYSNCMSLFLLLHH